MTTATLATGNRTMETAVRPRRSLEELVDRLIAALFSEQPQTEPATETLSAGQERPRGTAAQAGGGHGRGADGPRRGMDTTRG